MRDQLPSHQSFTFRVKLVMMFFFVLGGVILTRSIYLQAVGDDRLERRAQAQYEQRQSLKLQRGVIQDRQGSLLAVSLPMRSIYVLPQEVENPTDTARALAKALQLKADKLAPLLHQGKNFLWLKRNLPPREANKVMALGLKGVYSIKEYQRFYPQLNLAAHLTGFTGLDSKGLEGLEFRYNDHLMNAEVGAETWNPLQQGPKVNALSGGSIELTIDLVLQHYTEQELGKAVAAMKAKFGAAILMESQTGEILAMAVAPDYDPNNFLSYNESTFFNRAVTHTFEPGSTFKLVTMAAGLETESIAKGSFFFCENGKYRVGDRVIHDVAPYGFLDLEKIIQKSSNICISKIAQLIPKDKFHEIITRFGFGQKTGVGLGGEAPGTLHDYSNWTDVTRATLSYGHGISATPIQVLAATNVFATGGEWVQPRLIKHLRRANGEEVDQPEQERHQAISRDVAMELRGYMKSVVTVGGTGQGARVPGMPVAGKTGTSRKYDPKINAYSSQLNVSSFVGFFPADNPKLTLIVVLDEPTEWYLHAKSASVVFREIAKQAIRHYPLEGDYVYEPVEAAPAFAAAPRVAAKVGLETALLGKTLRQALNIASSRGLTLKAQGQGRVAEVWHVGNEARVRLR